MKRTNPPVPFILRLDAGIKEQAAIRAKEESRSLNGHIENLIKNDLKNKK